MRQFTCAPNGTKLFNKNGFKIPRSFSSLDIKTPTFSLSNLGNLFRTKIKYEFASSQKEGGAPDSERRVEVPSRSVRHSRSITADFRWSYAAGLSCTNENSSFNF